jgi:hypothetical protein
MLKVGRANVICKGKIVLGEKPTNMIFSVTIYLLPFLIFNLLKLKV